MNPGAISRYPVPELADLPEDIRTRMLEVRQKARSILSQGEYYAPTK